MNRNLNWAALVLISLLAFLGACSKAEGPVEMAPTTARSKKPALTGAGRCFLVDSSSNLGSKVSRWHFDLTAGVKTVSYQIGNAGGESYVKAKRELSEDRSHSFDVVFSRDEISGDKVLNMVGALSNQKTEKSLKTIAPEIAAGKFCRLNLSVGSTSIDTTVTISADRANHGTSESEMVGGKPNEPRTLRIGQRLYLIRKIWHPVGNVFTSTFNGKKFSFTLDDKVLDFAKGDLDGWVAWIQFD